ncbi:hypothetical protein MTO96_013290 [Rhipicephalus appendiculatus]
MWGKEDRSEKLGEERGRETETQFINEARSQRQHCGAELVVAEPRWSQPSSLGLWRRRTRFEHQKGAARPPPPTRNRRRRPLSPRRRAPPVRWPSPRTQARALRLYPTERGLVPQLLSAGRTRLLVPPRLAGPLLERASGGGAQGLRRRLATAAGICLQQPGGVLAR